MSLTTVTNTNKCFSVDGKRMQLVSVSEVTGGTSGTITPSGLSRVDHCLMPSGFTLTAATTYSKNVATLAYSVPAETAASRVVQDITYTAAVGQGAAGGNYRVTYTNGGTAGAEVVTYTAGTSTLGVQIQSGTSTATQIKAALDTAALTTGLITYAITGTGSNTQTSAAPVNLTGGVDGGAFGDVLCIGV